MKLAFVNFYSGYAQRGGETYLDSLATRLAEKHEVVLFQAGPKEKNKRYLVEEVRVSLNTNHPHSKLPVTHPLKRLFLDYAHIKELLFTVKILPKLWKMKPDFIFPQNSGWQVLLLRIFSTLINAKVIVAGQSGPGWNDRVNLYIHPDLFIALTKTQAEWARKATPWKNQLITVIPNGVDLEKFTPRGEKRVTGLSSPVILAVGAAIKSKRVSDTIRAVAQLKKASLLVVGTGPDESMEDGLGKELLGERYKRLKVNHEDMPSVYRSADVFTLCSDSSEAFGIVYLEALASGLPCVATSDPSRKEIVGSVGFYVKDTSNSKEYSEKLSEAQKSKSKDLFVKQARKYSWDKIAAKYEKILDKK